MLNKKDVAIIGYAEAKIEVKSGRDVYDLGAEVLSKVIEKTGIDKNEINGMVVNASSTAAGNPFWSPVFSDYMGLELDFCQTSDLGGASSNGALFRACMAVQNGLADTVLVIAVDASSTGSSQDFSAFRGEWADPIGLMGPPGLFGLLTTSYMANNELKFEALGKMAVTQREHAILNENACEKLRKPITIDDYMNSRMISDPIRLLDCVMPCDGANAILVTSTKRAKELGIKNTVHPVGYGERTNFDLQNQLTDPATSGHKVAAEKAMGQAGMTAKDIQMFQPYDDFLIAMLLQMEMIGFCKKGQGSDFILDTNMMFDGDLPLNTGGGQISAGQPGLAGGGVNTVEAVRQLMGEGGPRQVPNPKNAMVTGIGWIPYIRNWGVSTALILEAA